MTAHQVRARNTDPDTSHAAAADAESRATTIRDRVMAVMAAAPEARDGITHDQLITLYRKYAMRLGWPPASDSGIRTRCNELWKDGHVERIENARGKSRFRRDAVLWRAVPGWTTEPGGS
jgi:hypothetical protein